eukprot:TRINITY_DN9311_c0_g2_i3.p1 TRINITY_DN9311_c0_g2~~TRINITY_DN9311_c0_g2_i3.p1  ORF type:complete len:157 (-),score=38.93 TRINITY_DN9311_c0_g2_i3:205-675(-)
MTTYTNKENCTNLNPLPIQRLQKHPPTSLRPKERLKVDLEKEEREQFKALVSKLERQEKELEEVRLLLSQSQQETLTLRVSLTKLQKELDENRLLLAQSQQEKDILQKQELEALRTALRLEPKRVRCIQQLTLERDLYKSLYTEVQKENERLSSLT